MRSADAIKTLEKLDRRGQAVFTTGDLRAIFPERSEKTFTSSLARLVAQGVLQRAARGVYIYPQTRNRLYRLERVALTLRRDEVSYVSLETALAAYSIISQQTLDNITVMTTGRKGRFCTPWGCINFTHTARSASEIWEATVDDGRPLRRAKPRTALEDLKRVHRCLELVDLDQEELELIEHEMKLPPPSNAEKRQLLYWQQLPWVNAPAAAGMTEQGKARAP